MRSKYALVAESVVIDRDTNEIVIGNVFEALNSPGFPLLFRRATFIVALEPDPGEENDEHTVTFTATLAGNEIVTHNHFFTFNGQPIARVAMRISGLAIVAPGPLVFALRRDGNAIAEYTINVTQAAAGTALPPGAPGPLAGVIYLAAGPAQAPAQQPVQLPAANPAAPAPQPGNDPQAH